MAVASGLWTKLPLVSTHSAETLQLAGSVSHLQYLVVTPEGIMMTTRYFRTFGAESYPVEPRGELNPSDIHKFTTYYEARYDAENRLREFEKHLRQRGPADTENWISSFVERYDYWPNGRLKTRRLIGPDNAVIGTWDFDDSAFRWTSFLSRWIENWMGSPDSTKPATGSFAEKVCACHALVNEMESGLFRDTDTVRDIYWACREISEAVPNFKALFEFLLPGSKPRVSFITYSQTSTGDHLAHSIGFDELVNVAIIDQIRPHALERQFESTPIDLCDTTNLDLDAKKVWLTDYQSWLEENDIAAAYAVPIRLANRVVASLLLCLCVGPGRAEAAGIVSIFQRQGMLVQSRIQLTREFAANLDEADTPR